MKLPEDIAIRIRRDFVQESPNDVIALLEKLSADEPETFAEPRILRCAVYMAKGTRKGLDEAITLARIDFPDLIMNGEYIPGNDTPVRDMRKPFSN